MSNFQFLESHWTDLAKLGDLSEKYVYSDPNTSIIKQGILSEVMVKYMLAYDGIAEPAYDNTHANRIRILKNNDLLPREIDNTLYILRKARNDAAHNAADEGEKALNNLQLMYELCVWYPIYGSEHCFYIVKLISEFCFNQEYIRNKNTRNNSANDTN